MKLAMNEQHPTIPKGNDTTKVTQLAVDCCLFLAEFGPYIYASSLKTSSIYIKFRHFGLGTLRISNHKSKYLYKWNLSVKSNFVDRVTHKRNSVQYYGGIKNKNAFLTFMKDSFE